jgi:hypothetical protein
MAVAAWAANTTNQAVQDQFPVPSGFAGDMTIEIFGRSADSGHSTLLALSWACVGSAAVDNPTFTTLPPIRFTGNSSNARTLVSGTFTAPCGTGDDFYWKLTADTTGLTGGATFDLIALRFSTATLQ